MEHVGRGPWSSTSLLTLDSDEDDDDDKMMHILCIFLQIQSHVTGLQSDLKTDIYARKVSV